jgi:hypothetical protein
MIGCALSTWPATAPGARRAGGAANLAACEIDPETGKKGEKPMNRDRVKCKQVAQWLRDAREPRRVETVLPNWREYLRQRKEGSSRA